MGNIISQVPPSNESTTVNSRFNVTNLFGSSSRRYLARGVNNRTAYSVQRSSSLLPRCRLTSTPLPKLHKALWPISRAEVIFLPEFPASADKRYQNFFVRQAVAKGTYGHVYRVSKEGKEYALKVLSKAQVVSEDAVRQVKEEAKIQQLCGHHTFIVDSVSRWQTKKHLYILSEYVCGGELFTLLRRCGSLPEQLVKIYVAELAIALDFLHNAGVIYRDLKPENVLLDSLAHLKLIDFGLSKWLSRGSTTFTLCGTANYMAPEIFSGRGYSHAVDWWSLGVVTCRMLTNQYPAGRGEAHGTLPHDAVLSAPARKLLSYMLERDPQNRLRGLRQLRQTAFYMSYNFDGVIHKKVSPKSILEKEFPEFETWNFEEQSDDLFKSFDNDHLNL